MSETRKNHLTIDGGQVKEDEHISTYKTIPESDTAPVIEYVETETDGEYVPQQTEDILEEESECHWDRKAITQLLNLYLQNINKFRNPKVRKKNVWLDIASAVGKNPYQCDKKFRNLKQTYIRLLKKKSIDGRLAVKWPYFDVFEEIYSENGEYNSDIQQKLQDSTSENVAKALLSITESNEPEFQENGGSSNVRTEELKRRINRKRHLDFKKFTNEFRDRQRTVEEKLDKLLMIVEESNDIQRERNRLFEQFLGNINQTS